MIDWGALSEAVKQAVFNMFLLVIILSVAITLAAVSAKKPVVGLSLVAVVIFLIFLTTEYVKNVA